MQTSCLVGRGGMSATLRAVHCSGWRSSSNLSCTWRGGKYGYSCATCGLRRRSNKLSCLKRHNRSRTWPPLLLGHLWSVSSTVLLVDVGSRRGTAQGVLGLPRHLTEPARSA